MNDAGRYHATSPSESDRSFDALLRRASLRSAATEHPPQIVDRERRVTTSVCSLTLSPAPIEKPSSDPQAPSPVIRAVQKRARPSSHSEDGSNSRSSPSQSSPVRKRRAADRECRQMPSQRPMITACTKKAVGPGTDEDSGFEANAPRSTTSAHMQRTQSSGPRVSASENLALDTDGPGDMGYSTDSDDDPDMDWSIDAYGSLDVESSMSGDESEAQSDAGDFSDSEYTATVCPAASDLGDAATAFESEGERKAPPALGPRDVRSDVSGVSYPLNDDKRSVASDLDAPPLLGSLSAYAGSSRVPPVPAPAHVVEQSPSNRFLARAGRPSSPWNYTQASYRPILLDAAPAPPLGYKSGGFRIGKRPTKKSAGPPPLLPPLYPPEAYCVEADALSHANGVTEIKRECPWADTQCKRACSAEISGNDLREFLYRYRALLDKSRSARPCSRPITAGQPGEFQLAAHIARSHLGMTVPVQYR
ncbi:hypothetical protein GGG16DRAFT_126792 [Schizophyllum commune]